MSIYLIVFIAALFTGLLSLIGGLVLLWRPVSDRILQLLVSFAAGSLLAAAFLDILPEAAEEYDINQVLLYALVGILLFFVAEKFLLWHHHSHNHSVDHLGQHSAQLILWGDVLHNFIDGPIIAIAFLSDFKLGVITTLAIIFHEIPQEVGDFAVMLKSGLARTKVLLYNLISSSATILGAGVALLFSDLLNKISPALLGLAAGAFIYIAAADLIHSIHHETDPKTVKLQTLFLLLGVVVIGLLVHWLE